MPKFINNHLTIIYVFICSASVAFFATTSAEFLTVQPTGRNLAAATTPSTQPQSQKEDKVGDCGQAYRACVKTAKSDVLREKCESDWRKCVSGQCKERQAKTPNGIHKWCPRDVDCKSFCTEATTGKGGFIGCCVGGPQHVNKCPTKIGEKCYDKISAREFADLTKKNILNDTKTTPTEKVTELDERTTAVFGLTQDEITDAEKKRSEEWNRAEDLKDAVIQEYRDTPSGSRVEETAQQKLREMFRQTDEIKTDASNKWWETQKAAEVLRSEVIRDKTELEWKVTESTLEAVVQQTTPMPISPPAGNTFGRQVTITPSQPAPTWGSRIRSWIFGR